MSHLHIPDGLLPAWIVVAGWASTGLLLLAVTRRVEAAGRRHLPLLGALAALMLVGMSVELVPIGYHVNLSVIAGIVLGPVLAFLAAFVVDLVLALLGHGGITVVGLNTLVIGAEAALGFAFFRGLGRLLGGRLSDGVRAGLATAASLLFSTVLTIGIVAIAAINPAAQAPHGAAVVAQPDRLEFRNPFSQGAVAWELGRPEGERDAAPVKLSTFAALTLTLAIPGWLLEATLTGLIVAHVRRLRPDLLAEASGPRPAARAERVSASRG